MLRDIDIIQTIKLSYPIPYKNNEGNIIDLHELKIGRLKAKHLDSLPSSFINTSGVGGGKKKFNFDLKEIVPFVASVTELPIETIRELDLNDLIIVSDMLADSMGVKDKGK